MLFSHPRLSKCIQVAVGLTRSREAVIASKQKHRPDQFNSAQTDQRRWQSCFCQELLYGAPSSDAFLTVCLESGLRQPFLTDLLVSSRLDWLLPHIPRTAFSA